MSQNWIEGRRAFELDQMCKFALSIWIKALIALITIANLFECFRQI